MIKTKEQKRSTTDVLAELEKKYGLNVASGETLSVVSSGSHTINAATGIGGIPRGKLIEIYGPESSGKSTISLEITASFQQAVPDKRVALFDYEHSYDIKYATSLGVDTDKLLIYQPDSQEQGYDMIIGLMEADLCSLIIIDSHTAALPIKIIEGEMGDITMGLQARNNSKFLGKVKGLMGRTGTSMIAVSQTRANIGGMGEVNVATGGNGWKFYADMRFKIWKTLEKANEANKTTLDVIKNKCAKPFGKAEFDIVWGEGIDNVGEILDMGVENGTIKRAGSWYSWKDMKLGQGTNGVKELFNDNPELLQEITQEVLSKNERI